MADFKEMDELELPSLDSLDNDVDTRFTGGSGDDADDEPLVGEAAYDPDDISMPVFSEMDGGFGNAPAPAPAQENKTVSLSKPAFEEMSPSLPVFEEMMPGDPKPVSAPQNMANTSNMSDMSNTSSFQSTSGSYHSNSGGYQSTSGGYQNTSGSYSAPSYTYNSTPSGNSYFDNLDVSSELAEKGRKKAKVLGIIIIVLSVLDILGGGVRGIGGSCIRIYGAYQFMKNASSGWRIYLCVVCVISMIFGIVNIAQVDSELLPLAAEYGVTWIVSIVQFIFIMYTVGMGVLSYFFIFDKSIKEYCRMP